MGYLLSRKLGGKFLKLYFVCSVATNIDCNKRGQTSRLVAGVHVTLRRTYITVTVFWVFFCCRCICLVLESPNKLNFSIHDWSSVSSHHN